MIVALTMSYIKVVDFLSCVVPSLLTHSASQMGGKGKGRRRKVPARPLDLSSILFCLGIVSMPGFRF